MSENSKAERLIELATDKRVILTEIAAIALLSYKARIWEDPSMLRNSKIVSLKKGLLRRRDRTAGWVDIQAARFFALDTMEAVMEGAPNQGERDRMLELKSRLEVAVGSKAVNAVAQIRGFKLGEAPIWHRLSSKKPLAELSGAIHGVQIETEDGRVSSLEEIDVEYGSPNLLDDSTQQRLRLIMGDRSFRADTHDAA